jgi:UDP-N-acetylmuramyl pentapeptide phosphotransferase/UDP-N-acetylglucosamine-1-phosphate transferase
VIVAAAGSGCAAWFGAGGWAPLLIACALPLAAVGLLDDQLNLSSLWRYGVQLLTAGALLMISPLFKGWIPSVPLLFFGVVAVLLLVTVTAVINFTNFMDGLDGLVASCMAVAFCTASFYLHGAFGLWILVGSLLGFLLWNWSPAKVFMGDVGSTFLGAIWAGVVLQSPTWLDAFGLLLVTTPLLADALICVPRRQFAGQKVFQAHRLHLFQRLHQAGWSHAQVALLYLAGTIVLGVSLLAGSWAAMFAVALLVLMMGIWLDQRVAVPFSESLRGT